MPYYLSEYVSVGLNRCKPRGAEQAGWSAIDLRADGGATIEGNGLNACLLYLPQHDPQNGLIQLAEHPSEEILGAQQLAQLRTRFNVALDGVICVKDLVADLLMTPPANGWKPLRPCNQRIVKDRRTGQRFLLGGYYEFFLGPMNWHMPAVSGGDTFTEDFGCADSSALTCDLTWVKYGSSSGAAWSLTNNRARCTFTGASDYQFVRAEHSTATANQYAQALLVTVDIDVAPALWYSGVIGRTPNSGSTHTYYSVYGFETQGAVEMGIEKFVAATQTTLANTALMKPSLNTNKVFRIQMSGTSITGLVDGVSTWGPVTDSAIDGSTVGGLRGGFYSYQDGAVNVAEWDNFEISDISAGSRPMFRGS